MRGTLEGRKSAAQKAADKYNEKINKMLPREFDVLEIEVKGKKVVADMRELLMIANTENKAEIIGAMNRAAPNFFYFGRLAVDLREALHSKEEEFDIWFSQKKDKYPDEASEKARERKVMTNSSEMYQQKKNELSHLRKFQGYCEIAAKSLDKVCSLLQSIGKLTVSGEENAKKNETLNFTPEGGETE